MSANPTEIAINLQAKFEYYLLGLIFAILGLSIQTAEFGRHRGADGFELVGWVTLFVAGVVGILRGEWIPVVYQIQSKRDTVRGELTLAESALERGQQVEFSFVEDACETVLRGQAAIDKWRETLRILDQQRENAESRIIKRYWLMKWTFMVGVACLFISRAYVPFLDLLASVACPSLNPVALLSHT